MNCHDRSAISQSIDGLSAGVGKLKGAQEQLDR